MMEDKDVIFTDSSELSNSFSSPEESHAISLTDKIRRGQRPMETVFEMKGPETERCNIVMEQPQGKISKEARSVKPSKPTQSRPGRFRRPKRDDVCLSDIDDDVCYHQYYSSRSALIQSGLMDNFDPSQYDSWRRDKDLGYRLYTMFSGTGTPGGTAAPKPRHTTFSGTRTLAAQHFVFSGTGVPGTQHTTFSSTETSESQHSMLPGTGTSDGTAVPGTQHSMFSGTVTSEPRHNVFFYAENGTTTFGTQHSMFSDTGTPATQHSMFSGTGTSATQHSTFSGTGTAATQHSTFSGTGTAATQHSTFSGTVTPGTQHSMFSGTGTSGTQHFMFSGTGTAATQHSVFSGTGTSGTQHSTFSGTGTPGTQHSVFSGTATPGTQHSTFSGTATPGTQHTMFFGTATPAAQDSVFSGTETPATETTPPQSPRGFDNFAYLDVVKEIERKDLGNTNNNYYENAPISNQRGPFQRVDASNRGITAVWSENETFRNIPRDIITNQNISEQRLGHYDRNSQLDRNVMDQNINISYSGGRQGTKRVLFTYAVEDTRNMSNSSVNEDEKALLSREQSKSSSVNSNNTNDDNDDDDDDKSPDSPETDKGSGGSSSNNNTSSSGSGSGSKSGSSGSGSSGSGSGGSGTGSSSSTSKSSSTSSSPSDDKKKTVRKKKKKKRKGFLVKMMKSSPDENKLLKVVLWFPVGLGLSYVLYYMIIKKMRMDEQKKAVIGAGVGFIVSLTFAFSVQMRCAMCLVVPTFVGKAGRAYIAAFSMVYLINGPITNIMDNAKEITRALSCNSALMANHSREKWRLRLHPVEGALGDLTKDSFSFKGIARKIEKAFAPIKNEIKENMKENKALEKNIKKGEELAQSKSKQDTVEEIEKKHETKDAKKAGEKVEKQWEKKLDLRCQNTFSQGVQKCKDAMGRLEDKCMDALSILGYLMCWPLKITIFCQIVKLLPGAWGMSCDSMNVVNPGFGDTFVNADAVVEDMEGGMNVQMQYKVEGKADIDYTPVEELRQGTIHEVEEKASIMDFFLSLVSHILTFTFLIVFKGAYKYNQKYLADLTFDNRYITPYFRHIDARRKALDKKTLLPLKKSERKDYIDPAKMKLTKEEKGKLTKGTIKLILRVVIAAIICYMDSLLFQVLEIIAKHSKIEYHQEGEHIIDIKVYGKGFMSALVESFLTKFNSKHKLDKITTNQECLPRPSETDALIIAFIFITYFLVWLFLYFEAFGLRMRRVIAAFFYRKREKKRVLYLYNELFRKRLGFLKHMRHKVRKQIRERELKKNVGLLISLQRQFPKLCKCLAVLQSAKDSCIICSEPENKEFHHCLTQGCGLAYCKGCWIDVKRKCYGCGEESDSDDDVESTCSASSDSD